MISIDFVLHAILSIFCQFCCSIFMNTNSYVSLKFIFKYPLCFYTNTIFFPTNGVIFVKYSISRHVTLCIGRFFLWCYSKEKNEFHLIINLLKFFGYIFANAFFCSLSSKEMAVISKRYIRKNPSWSIFCFGLTHTSDRWNH